MKKALKVDAVFGFGEEMHSTEALVENAQRLESLGFDGVMVSELAHDPFLPLSLLAHHTQKLELRTGIAVALARSPMNVASISHDLNALSQGRFVLGLGSQIKPHIIKRFNMPWHSPAKQMREYIEALHAIWDSWYEGSRLRYKGDYYQHTLMTPDFMPQNTSYKRPRTTMAAVGPKMMRTAAQVADGIIIHAFCTEKHFKQVTIPLLEEALGDAGKTMDDFEIQFPVFIGTGQTDEDIEAKILALKYRIGFYASTPAYRPVLETHGWEDLQPELTALTKKGQWDQLPAMISDEMLDAFAIVGKPIDVANQLKERFGSYVDRVALETDLPDEVLREQLEVIRSGV